MSNHYLPESTLDGKWSRTHQRFSGTPSIYSRHTEHYQNGYMPNRQFYKKHDDQNTPSEHVAPHRRFAKDAPRTHPMDTKELVPESLKNTPTYRLGNILLLVDSDVRSPYFAFTRKFYKSQDVPLFLDEQGNGYFSVHHYLQMRMILFFSGKVPESEPHFQSSEQLRNAAQDNYELYHHALRSIRSVSDLKRVMGTMKLREFNFDFWFQSQTILDAMTEANVLKFTQNQDLLSLMMNNTTENTLFMEVSGFDQCFFGSGYTMDFLEQSRHFYTDRPQLWRGWNNFGESVRLVRKIVKLQSAAPAAVSCLRKRDRSSLVSEDYTPQGKVAKKFERLDNCFADGTNGSEEGDE